MIDPKKIKKTDVIRDSQLERKYLYQLFSGERTPSREKLIAIAFGMHLSEEETKKLLKIAGKRELYARDQRDAVILYGVQRRFSLTEVNELLFEHQLRLIE